MGFSEMLILTNTTKFSLTLSHPHSSVQCEHLNMHSIHSQTHLPFDGGMMNGPIIISDIGVLHCRKIKSKVEKCRCGKEIITSINAKSTLVDNHKLKQTYDTHSSLLRFCFKNI